MLSDTSIHPDKPRYTINDLAALQTFAQRVLVALRRRAESGAATVFALSGDLGAGKTALVQAIGSELGVLEPITSPTFTIMQRYETADEQFRELIHLDAYRFESAAELRPLKFSNILDETGTLVLVEWPERITGALPPDTPTITLSITKMPARTATVRGLDITS